MIKFRKLTTEQMMEMGIKSYIYINPVIASITMVLLLAIVVKITTQNIQFATGVE